MDDLNSKSNDEISAIAAASESKDELRMIADHFGVTYSGNTGIEKMKEHIETHLAKVAADASENPVLQALAAGANQVQTQDPKPAEAEATKFSDLTRAQLRNLNPRDRKYTEVERRAIVRSRALELFRVKVTNLDPNDSALPGAIKTVNNKYTGKISKMVPFGEENEAGYHIPSIILNSMKMETFNMRREVKGRGSSFGIKVYKTVRMPKYNIEYLDALTEEELQALGQDQKARGALATED